MHVSRTKRAARRRRSKPVFTCQTARSSNKAQTNPVLAARFRARGLIFSTPPRGGGSAVRRPGACEAPARRARDAARRGRIDVPPHRPNDAGALRPTALHRGDFRQGLHPISASRLAPVGGYAISRCLPDKGLSRRDLASRRRLRAALTGRHSAAPSCERLRKTPLVSSGCRPI